MCVKVDGSLCKLYQEFVLLIRDSVDIDMNDHKKMKCILEKLKKIKD